jgi:hypothetical protein
MVQQAIFDRSTRYKDWGVAPDVVISLLSSYVLLGIFRSFPTPFEAPSDSNKFL